MLGVRILGAVVTGVNGGLYGGDYRYSSAYGYGRRPAGSASDAPAATDAPGSGG
jgi:hypothetical protein